MGTHGLSRKRTLDLCQDTCLAVTAFGSRDQKGPSVGSFNCGCITCLILIWKTISQLRLIFSMFGIIGDAMDLMAIIQGKVKSESKTKASP